MAFNAAFVVKKPASLIECAFGDGCPVVSAMAKGVVISAVGFLHCNGELLILKRRSWGYPKDRS